MSVSKFFETRQKFAQMARGVFRLQSDSLQTPPRPARTGAVLAFRFLQAFLTNSLPAAVAAGS